MSTIEPLVLERCDPDALLRSAMTRVSAAEVRTIFLDWLLRLPVDIDAAAAARVVLHHAGCAKTATPLGRLLEETSRYPRERLAAIQPAGRCQ